MNEFTLLRLRVKKGNPFLVSNSNDSCVLYCVMLLVKIAKGFKVKVNAFHFEFVLLVHSTKLLCRIPSQPALVNRFLNPKNIKGEKFDKKKGTRENPFLYDINVYNNLIRYYIIFYESQTIFSPSTKIPSAFQVKF